MNRVLLLLAGTAFSLSVLAGDTSAGTDAIPDASITVMLTGAKRYDDCLQIWTTEYLSASEDVRAVADAAMKHCDGTLQEMERELAEAGLPEAARAEQIARIRDSVVRKLMPALVARRADAPVRK
jgi:hypothetical protein